MHGHSRPWTVLHLLQTPGHREGARDLPVGGGLRQRQQSYAYRAPSSLRLNKRTPASPLGTPPSGIGGRPSCSGMRAQKVGGRALASVFVRSRPLPTWPGSPFAIQSVKRGPHPTHPNENNNRTHRRNPSSLGRTIGYRGLPHPLLFAALPFKRPNKHTRIPWPGGRGRLVSLRASWMPGKGALHWCACAQPAGFSLSRARLSPFQFTPFPGGNLELSGLGKQAFIRTSHP